ncbi:MAG: hypothetical protein PHF24_06675 [Syntrophomonas sp.]|nr:hypothetical protein [Syntrophomonas sp.]
MRVIKRVIIVCLMGFMFLGTAGCNTDYKQLLPITGKQEEPLIKVLIQFTDKEQIECYVRSLGLEKNGEIYIGGSSLNYMYDQEGRIIGSFNYQRVLFIKIITDEESSN